MELLMGHTRGLLFSTVIGALLASGVTFVIMHAGASKVAPSHVLPGHDIRARLDSELVSMFRSHRHDFQKLLGMATEDAKRNQRDDDLPPIVIDLFMPYKDAAGESYDSQHFGIEKKRIEEYKSVLEAIGVRVAVSIGWKSEESELRDFTLVVVDSRFVWQETGSSYRIGYYYSENHPVDSMFSTELSGNQPRLAYRPLDSNWYLFFSCAF